MLEVFDKRFEDMFIRLLQAEGGYVNDNYDRGGETKYGISKNAYPKVDIENLTIDEARAIYYRDYYLKSGAHKIRDDYVAEKVFDISVNCGIRTAIRMLQSVVNVYNRKSVLEEDGIWGPATESAFLKVEELPSYNPNTFLFGLMCQQVVYYQSIVKSDPSQKKFLKGWINRAYRIY